MHKLVSRTVGLAVALGLGANLTAASLDFDARRGAEFFKTQMCVNCHGLQGVSEGKAPDLGRRLDRNYTPAGVAAQIWTHAPVMWGNMKQQNIAVPQVTPSQSADMFAFFYASRYFEKPGEAERGKQVFQAKHCTTCHALTGGAGIGPSVDRWDSLSSPVLLIQQMWNHQRQMGEAMSQKNIERPRLTSQDLTDLLVYLQNLPQTRNKEASIILPPAEQGEPVFRAKGCIECHKGEMALENRLGDSTLTDVAAAMWNHAPQMRQPAPQLSAEESRQLISYVWAKQFFSTRGDANRGRKTFQSKKCSVCHDDRASGAPPLAKGADPYSAITMVSALWRHGPAMLSQMEAKHIAWPRVSQQEMTNLIAYLNSR
jgi:mono/diheme cytochrome c family protein